MQSRHEEIKDEEHLESTRFERRLAGSEETLAGNPEVQTGDQKITILQVVLDGFDAEEADTEGAL